MCVGNSLHFNHTITVLPPPLCPRARSPLCTILGRSLCEKVNYLRSFQRVVFVARVYMCVFVPWAPPNQIWVCCAHNTYTHMRLIIYIVYYIYVRVINTGAWQTKRQTQREGQLLGVNVTTTTTKKPSTLASTMMTVTNAQRRDNNGID